MKKFLVLFLAVTMLFVFTACAKSEPEKAYMVGHDDITFNEAAEKRMQAASAQIGAEYSVEWKDGWSGEYEVPSKTPPSDEEKVMCKLNLIYDSGNDVESMILYLTFNTSNNTLYPYALTFDESGSVYKYGQADALDFIETIYSADTLK